MALQARPARSLRLWRVALMGPAALVAVGALMLVGGSATASPGATTPPVPKSAAPANINPDKQPEIVPPVQTTPQPTPKLAPDEAARQAREWADQDPYSRVACFGPDGSLLTLVEVDRVNPSQPISVADQAQVCSEVRPPTG